MSSENLREEIAEIINDCVNRESFTPADLDRVFSLLKSQIEQMELPNYITWDFEDRKKVTKIQQDMLKAILSKLQ